MNMNMHRAGIVPIYFRNSTIVFWLRNRIFFLNHWSPNRSSGWDQLEHSNPNDWFFLQRMALTDRRGPIPCLKTFKNILGQLILQ